MFHLDQLQVELLAAVAVQIKTVDRQVLQVLLDEAELTLLVVLVQLETQVVQQLDRCLATVLICKVAHRVTKQILKAVAVAVAVTTAVAVVAQTLTHAAPTPEAAVVDLHTPTHLL